MTEKVRVELRFDADVYERLKAGAEKAGISVNQLMHGIARWAGQNLELGEPRRDESGFVRSKPVPGCVFFGRLGHYWNEEDHYHLAPGEELEGDGDPGVVHFALDFTERNVVREAEPAEGTAIEGKAAAAGAVAKKSKQSGRRKR